MQNLGPVQFNFDHLWNRSLRVILSKDTIRDEFSRIQNHWMEIADSKYESHAEHDEEFAYEEFELDEHIGRVRVRDLHWLRSTFENIDLTGLALAIAQDQMPGKTWEIIEDDEEAVVTDTERSIVFDMKRGNKVPAGTSLLIAGDKKYVPTAGERTEFNRWLENRREFTRQVMIKIETDIARSDHPGIVVPLHISGARGDSQ